MACHFAAYEVLSDPNERAFYDRHRENIIYANTGKFAIMIFHFYPLKRAQTSAGTLALFWSHTRALLAGVAFLPTKRNDWKYELNESLI